MTAVKPKIDPAKLKPVSGRGRMTIEHPVRIVKKPSESSVAAAAGIDTHPGGEQLKHYWVHGEGAAKWATWTELYHHLVKYLNPEMAKRTAAEWFHLRYGFWPGDHRNDKHGVAAKFNPDELREPHSGKWVGDGAVKDALKLAGKIDLAPGELLTGSDKVNGHIGQVNLAWTEHNGSRRLRLGALGGENAGRWRAGNKGSTVNLDEHEIRNLHSGLQHMATEGKAAAAELKTLHKQFDSIEAVHGINPDRMPPDVAATYRAMQARYDLLTGQDHLFATGDISSAWGKLRFGVRANESGGGFETFLAVEPKSLPADWELPSAVHGEEGASLTGPQLAKLIGWLNLH